jgi:hypothetical protein
MRFKNEGWRAWAVSAADAVRTRPRGNPTQIRET